jgi:thioredoxin reductase (NADPH)
VDARYQKIEAEGLEDFEGCGVFYAATHVERMTCGEAPVAMVGAGNSAGQAAVFMAETSSVNLVVRGGELRKSMSSYLVRRIEALAEDGRINIYLRRRLEGGHSRSSVPGALNRHPSSR